MRKILILILTAILTGCLDSSDQLRIDREEKPTKTAIEELTRRLPQNEREQFQRNIWLVALDHHPQGRLLIGTGLPDERIDSLVFAIASEHLVGKTVGQIATEAEAIRAKELVLNQEKIERKRQNELAEIETFEDAIQKNESARAMLRRFSIDSIALRTSENRLPMIEIRASNGTSERITDAHIRATVTFRDSASQSIIKHFSLRIPNGIAPGKSGSWTIMPPPDREWREAASMPDAVITAEVFQLEGSGSRLLYDAEGLTPLMLERYNKLKAVHGK